MFHAPGAGGSTNRRQGEEGRRTKDEGLRTEDERSTLGVSATAFMPSLCVRGPRCSIVIPLSAADEFFYHGLSDRVARGIIAIARHKCQG